MRRPKQLGIIDSRSELPPWLERLGGSGKLALDTETTGLDWTVDLVGGLGLAANHVALYAVGDALGPSVRWLADQVKRRRPITGHNIKFDLHMLRRTFGLHVPYPVDDVMVQSFLIDNRGCPKLGVLEEVHGYYGGHELKSLAQVYVDPEAKDAERAVLAAIKEGGGRNKSDLLMAPLAVQGKYGALDAWYTLQLDVMFIERIRYWSQPWGDWRYPSLWSLYENERWLLLALRDMEERGIAVEPAFFETWKKLLEKDIVKTKQNLKGFAGREVNWSSPDQLRELLFGKLKQRPTRWTKGGKKGIKKPSTDEVSLLDLKHPIGAELLRLRDFEKQHSTYASGLLKAVVNGRIHPSFKQTGADTGRLSCVDPNLQQVPRESGARRGFRTDKGLVLRFADYSQVEMRFAAHSANDPTLVRGFLDDPNFDTHAATAKKMWGLKNEPTSRQRKFAKIMNFAILYGAGLGKIASSLISLLSVADAMAAVKEFGYALKPGETPHRALAELLRNRYFKEFPAVRGAARHATELAEQRGLAMNHFGRHRFLDDGKEYTAFNTEIQGDGADMAKRGLVNLYRELQLGSSGCIALLLQIHDEAVYLSDGDPKVDRRVLELLKETKMFRIPIIADVSGSATTWQDKKKITL